MRNWKESECVLVHYTLINAHATIYTQRCVCREFKNLALFMKHLASK